MQPQLGGGSIYDTGCYPLNFVGMILNQEPISVSAQYTYENGVDTMFTGILKYSNDTIAVINSGFNAFDRNYSEIIGTKGIIQVPDTFLGTSGFITVITKDGERQIPVEESDRYLLEIEDFANAIINDKKPTISMEDSIRDMKIMDQLLALR